MSPMAGCTYYYVVCTAHDGTTVGTSSGSNCRANRCYYTIRTIISILCTTSTGCVGARQCNVGRMPCPRCTYSLGSTGFVGCGAVEITMAESAVRGNGASSIVIGRTIIDVMVSSTYAEFPVSILKTLNTPREETIAGCRCCTIRWAA
jgi:hypothetical protein